MEFIDVIRFLMPKGYVGHSNCACHTGKGYTIHNINVGPRWYEKIEKIQVIVATQFSKITQVIEAIEDIGTLWVIEPTQNIEYAQAIENT